MATARSRKSDPAKSDPAKSDPAKSDPAKSDLTHLRSDGSVQMVDVSGKAETLREAVALAEVHLGQAASIALRDNPKGNVLEVARIAGISAAKRTAELIPLCHNLPLTGIEMNITLHGDRVRILSTVRTTAGTGVEMEALTAASIAALTVYDMCKAAGHGITIERICLLRKSGGRSGIYLRSSDDADTNLPGDQP